MFSNPSIVTCRSRPLCYRSSMTSLSRKDRIFLVLITRFWDINWPIIVMMIPVVGVFSGAWMLDEIPHWQDYAAMVLILTAMSTVLLKPRIKSAI